MSSFTSVLPNNYLKKECPYYYKVVDGVDHSFFVNDVTPITGITFGNLRLSVFDVYGTEVISDAKALSQVIVTGGYRVYCEDINITGLQAGHKYRYIIYDTNDNSVLYVFNWFEFTNDASPLVQISYRNSSDIFNYSYEALSSYRNVVFVDLNVIDGQSELEREGYLEASTGFYRNQKSQVKFFSTLESYFFDSTAHAAMQGLAAHDDILLNGRAYQTKENYEIETNIRNGQSKGTIDFWDQALNEINLNL